MKWLREPSRCVGPPLSPRELNDAFTGLRSHRGSVVRAPSMLSCRAARVSSGEARNSILMPSRQNCSRRTWRRLLLECVLEGARLGNADLDSLGYVRIKQCTISRVPNGQQHMWRFSVYTCGASKTTAVFLHRLFCTLPIGVTSESSGAFSKAIGHQVLARLAKQALRHVHASGRGDGDVFGCWHGGHQRKRRSPRHLR